MTCLWIRQVAVSLRSAIPSCVLGLCYFDDPSSLPILCYIFFLFFFLGVLSLGGQFLRLRRLCSEDSDFSLKSEEMCEFFDKRGYPASVVGAGHIAPNKLIGSQHYKRLRRRIAIEFHSLSHFTLTTTQYNPSF